MVRLFAAALTAAKLAACAQQPLVVTGTSRQATLPTDAKDGPWELIPGRRSARGPDGPVSS
jgi:hypothetical protein